MNKMYEVNAQTGEEVIRDLTSEELAEAANVANNTVSKEAAKTALLARLGITAEEAQLLLGGY